MCRYELVVREDTQKGTTRELIPIQKAYIKMIDTPTEKYINAQKTTTSGLDSH